MRPALDAREHAPVDLLGQLLLAQDQRAARAAQALMRGGRHDIRVRNGAGVHARHNEARDMRDIGHEARLDAPGDLRESLPVDDARVGRGASDDQLRPVLLRQRGDSVVIEEFGLRIHAVVHEVVELAREADRAAVRQVTALAQLHAHHRVAGLEQGEVHGHVGRAARIRLNVGVLRSEQLLGAVDGELLDVVDEADALVIPSPRITFGVLDIQVGGQTLQHRRRSVVFAGDEVEGAGVALAVALDQREDLRINRRQ